MNREKLFHILLVTGIVCCISALLALAVLIPASVRQLVQSSALSERATVQRLAGALLSEHPELESGFVAALQQPSEQDRALGSQILSRYGYEDLPRLQENPSYMSALNSQRKKIIAFLGCALGLLILWLFWLTGQSRRQYKQLLRVLDSYLNEDYTFADAGYWGRSSGEGIFNLAGEKLKQLGNQIRLKNGRIQEEKENTKAFVTDISHQLKTPIASLKTCFSLLLESESEKEKEEFFERSRLQIDKLETLTQTLVNISRLENAMICLIPKPISLFELLVRSVNSIYDKASQKEIQLELEPFDDFPVQADLK